MDGEGEAWARRKDGATYAQWLSVSGVRDGHGTVTHSITLFRDITLQREAQDRIQRLAHFDPLTNLPNRALLAERAHRHIAEEQTRGGTLAMLFLDLDHFKNVNDSLGHRTGDILLVAVAQRLQALLRPQDTVSRLGGDEFLLLLPATTPAVAADMATRLLAAVAQPFQVESYELTTTLSVGIAMYPSDGDSFDTLYQRADAAMYRAKQNGRNRYGFFTADLEARTARALLIENALRRALERNQFEVHYQPQVSLTTRQVVGAEALLRWRHPELGVVSPAEFIPVAESSGMIVAIGEWVIHTAVNDAKRWLDQQLPLRAVSVNLSAVQFRHPQLPEMVTRCLAQAGLPARRLELELTEGAAVDDPAAALAMMDDLHDRGVRLSMDDFGTGYSSLSYLKRFQIYKLKIDQSFVRDLDDDANDRAIVSAIISMAQALGMQTTAKGLKPTGNWPSCANRVATRGKATCSAAPCPPPNSRRTCEPTWHAECHRLAWPGAKHRAESACCYNLQQTSGRLAPLPQRSPCLRRTALRNCSARLLPPIHPCNAPCVNSKSCSTARAWALFSCASAAWCAATSGMRKFLAMPLPSGWSASALRRSIRTARLFVNWRAPPTRCWPRGSPFA